MSKNQKVVLSDEEFNSLPSTPTTKRAAKPKVELSDEEFSSLPQVTVDPKGLEEATGIMETIKSPFVAAGEFIDRGSKGFKSGISALANRRDPLTAAKLGLETMISPENAPTASQTLEDIGVPKKIAENPAVSTLADLTVFDPLNVAAGTAKILGKLGEVSKFTRTAAEKNYGKLKMLAGNSDAAIQTMERNKDALQLALTESDIVANLRRPNELKKLLTGKSLGLNELEMEDITTLPMGLDAGDFVRGGKIAQESKNVDNLISTASKRLKSRGMDVRIGELMDIVYPSRLRQVDIPGSGVGEEQFYKIKEIADRYVGNLFSKKDLSLEDLQAFKKKLGERLGSKDFAKLSSQDPTLALEKEVLTEMYLKTKGAILNLSDKVGLGEDINAANKKMQAYFTIDNIMTKPASVQVAVTSQGFPMANAAAAIGKTATGAAVGENLIPGYGWMRNAGALVGGAAGAKWAQPEIATIMDYLKYTMPTDAGQKLLTTNVGLRSMAQPEAQPMQAQVPAGKKYSFEGVKQFIEAPLNPDTESILNNKDFFLQKVQVFKPESYEEMKAMLEKTEPKRLSKMLAAWAYKNPHFFAWDDYNRFDGIIQQDVDVAKAISDIKKSDMSSIEKAKTIQNLKNRRGGVKWPR